MQEMWAPAQQMREQHDKLQEEYAQQELLGGAASLGLQEGIDNRAIADNRAYMTATKAAADELATKGFIDSGRRRQLAGLKSQYAQTILPIQNALKERDAAIKMDREMKARDQTYKSTFDPSSIAVTDYLKNNQAFSPKGVSVGVMAKDAASEFSQLKNAVSQKYPTIANSGVIGTLWTKVNSGVPLEDISGFIKNESANKNIDPKILSALGQEMHNIVENNLQKHGAYKAFGSDDKAMNELRSSVANMSIYALNDPKFGQMNDPMGIAKAQSAQAPPPPGKSYVTTEGSFDTPEIKEGERLRKLSFDGSGYENAVMMPSITGTYATKGAQNTAGDPTAYVRAINNYAKEAGVDPKYLIGNNPKISKKDLKSAGDRLISMAEEKHKSANKSIVLPINKEAASVIATRIRTSALATGNEITDIYGSKHKLEDIKLDNEPVVLAGMQGTYAQYVDKKGAAINVPISGEHIGMRGQSEFESMNAQQIKDARTMRQKDYKAKYNEAPQKILGHSMTSFADAVTQQGFTKFKEVKVSPAYWGSDQQTQ
jgi:hypothetical protein